MTPADPGDELERALRARLGEAAILSEPAQRAALSSDISEEVRTVPRIAIRPASVDALCAGVAHATGAGFAVVPRGGGHSYSGGYRVPGERTLLVDLRGLDAISEINQVDRYVRVQAGCTWSALFDALAERGLRVPSFGPLSGHRATIGGALSQGAAFFGSAQHGFIEDSVLGLSVVLASGELLTTGVSADGMPHPRPGGPDATGLFLSDCGALGVKAEALLRVVDAPAETRFASFDLPSLDLLLSAQIRLAGCPGLGECFGFDPVAHRNLAESGFGMMEGAQVVRDLVRAGAGLGGRLRGLAKVLTSGSRFVGDLRYSLHLSVEGESEAHVAQRLARAAAVVLELGAEPVPDTIPRVTRARPFRPIKALVGPRGERWVPVHGLLRSSDANAAGAAVEAVLAGEADTLERHGISVSLLTVLVGTAIIIEPQIFWPDALSDFAREHGPAEQRQRYGENPPAPKARTAAAALRARLGEKLRETGAEHLQIGRYYPYLARLDPARSRLLRAVKDTLDPHGLMNPGVLGL